jgi:hypothetical protein
MFTVPIISWFGVAAVTLLFLIGLSFFFYNWPHSHKTFKE